MVETIQWVDGAVVMIDQRRLPLEEAYVTCRTYEEVAEAIRNMTIRGAPAIGVAAAMGVALGVAHASAENLDRQFASICDTLASTRPTAVNLFWGIARVRDLYISLAMFHGYLELAMIGFFVVRGRPPVGARAGTTAALPVPAGSV